MDRIILHCDMNNFYASVECLYNPEIRDKPVAVCGSQEERRGIVLAKNYIAKNYGIKTGEPVYTARQKCPNLITVKPNFNLYMKFSKNARKIYSDYTDLIECFGIDECWLDITGSVKSFSDGEKLAHEIKERIKNELGITVSIGISFNKIFAKLGSDLKKPDAITSISRENFKNKIYNIPVEELLYVGRSTKTRFNRVCIYTIGDLANSDLQFIKDILGKNGQTLWFFANGYDNSPVCKIDYEACVKGIGNSMTTPKDLCTNDSVKLIFYVLSESVGERLRKHNLKGKTIQISIKDTDLNYIERQGKLSIETYSNSEIAEKAYDIFKKSWNWVKDIHALGIRVTDLVPSDEYIQTSFLDDTKSQKREKLDCSIDSIRSRFGHYSIQRALLLTDNLQSLNPTAKDSINSISFFKGGNEK